MVRLVLACLVLLVTTPVAAQDPEFEPGALIVHWHPEALSRQIHRVGTLSVGTRRSISPTAELVRLRSRTVTATRKAIAALRDDPRVVHVEPNYIRRVFRVPNDTHYALQWNIRSARLEQAWDMLTGNPDIVVAVVDTGIYHGHPDLAGRVAAGYDFISDVNNAGDKNGWDPDPRDEGTESLASSAFHGTHVAGIIGAASNNGKGIAGVDWACKILPVRALGIEEGKGRDADIASAIRWAAGVAVPNAPQNPTPARVINLSFGGPGASYLLADAVKAAQDKGAIVVAAAGNLGSDVKNIYPAVLPGVVTVGATGLDNVRAPYSNYGQELDVMAPGGNMVQKLPQQYQGKDWYAGILGTLYSTADAKYTYQPFEGTSQAAPLVAGIVSLMLKINPSLNSAETINILKKTANVASTCPEGCGAGLVDAAAALTMTKGGGGGGRPAPGEKLPFSYQCSNDAQCSGGMCRAVAGRQICTQACAADIPCPAGSDCVGGLCAASGDPTYSNNPSTGPQTVWGGGCALVLTRPKPSHTCTLLLLLLLIRVRRRS